MAGTVLSLRRMFVLANKYQPNSNLKDWLCSMGGGGGGGARSGGGGGGRGRRGGRGEGAA